MMPFMLVKTEAPAGATADTPPDADVAALPALPHDVLRMIWQAAWRSEAASMLQRGGRAWLMRRAWRRMRGLWSCMRYFWKYVAKDSQLRGALHFHTLIFHPS